MEPITDFFQCNWCLEQYSDPVVFPCGHTACEKHTDDLRKEQWTCRLCGGTHKLADGEKFLTNIIVVNMLAANLSRLDFGPNYKAAKSEVDVLESKRAELKHVIDAPGDHASMLCRKYRNQVDLEREEMLKIVDAVCESKNKLITEYQRQVEKNLTETTSSKESLIESVDLKIKSWRETLSELVVNEARWKEITSEAQELQKDIKSQVDFVLAPPPAIQYLSKSIETSVWTEVAKKVRIREYKLAEDMNDKSLLISEVSKIAKEAEKKDIISEPFTHNGEKWKLAIEFNKEDDNMLIGPYVCLLSDPPKKVAWRFNLIGKHFQIIKHQDFDKEFTDKLGWGYKTFVSVNDILAHPAYDAEEDAVRVEVVFK